MIKIYRYNTVSDDMIFARSEGGANVEQTVSEIIQNVRLYKDKALKEYSVKFDHAQIDDFSVSDEETEKAIKSVEPEFIRVLEEAAQNIRDFHSKQIRNSFIISEKDGIVCGQKIIPIENVGLYVPGGTAAYPSTVLMDSIPAKLAGCKNLVMVSPPSASGTINPVILAAAKIAGIDKVYKVGGAQAIAALAYGTESVPKVDVIAGPGNIFVTLAKKEVYGQVGIDMLAGPSEILIIADDQQNPKFVAADVLSQAEHDKLARALLLTPSRAFAEKVAAEVERQLALLPRREIAEYSVRNAGGIILVKDLDEACALANEIAPEHLELATENCEELLPEIRNAGAVFMGSWTSEPLGDYFAGPDHTLPTGGTARFFEVLNQDIFLRKMSVIQYTKKALFEDGEHVIRLAENEQLGAHANAVRVRLEEK